MTQEEKENLITVLQETVRQGEAQSNLDGWRDTRNQIADSGAKSFNPTPYVGVLAGVDDIINDRQEQIDRFRKGIAYLESADASELTEEQLKAILSNGQ